MGFLIIDCEGELWQSNSRKLRLAYDSPYSGGEFSDYAIRNLGFIGLYLFGKSCQILLRPSLVTKTALITLVEWVNQSKFDRFVLSNAETNANLSLFTRPDQLLQSIDQMAIHLASDKFPDYILEDSVETKNPAFRKLHETMLQRSFNLSDNRDVAELQRVAAEAFKNRYVISELNLERAELTFLDIGNDLFRPYEAWRASAIGTSVGDLPDKPYGDWVEESYMRALLKNEVVHQKVDAIVRWPRAGKSRERYERTFIPIVGPQGPIGMISGTTADNRIDLRRQTG